MSLWYLFVLSRLPLILFKKLNFKGILLKNRKDYIKELKTLFWENQINITDYQISASYIEELENAVTSADILTVDEEDYFFIDVPYGAVVKFWNAGKAHGAHSFSKEPAVFRLQRD